MNQSSPQALSIMLGYWLGFPFRTEAGVQTAARMVRDLTGPSQCPAPRRKQIIATAARSLQCDEPATVLTAIVVRDRSGNYAIHPGKTCVYHSIETACWKLTQAILEHDHIAEART